MVTRTDDARLTQADLQAVGTMRERMLAVDRGPAAKSSSAASGPGVIPSQDGKAAIALVPFDGSLSGFALTDAVKAAREAGDRGLPSDLRAQLTGGPGFGADIANSFSGANFRLILITAVVVALLLLLTYRSPILWLIPLIVVALADRLAAIVAGHAISAFGIEPDGSTSGITSVLVFGAGTNYALLLISRYREELRTREDHRAALRHAVRHAVPAILASNLTVVLALASLIFAVLPSNRALGISAATGILTALIVVLLMLPPALAIFGRKLFWPFIPRPGEQQPVEHGAWHRIADAVARQPVRYGAAAVLVLVACSFGLLGAKVGLSQTEKFRVAAESVDGSATLAAHYPAGEANPTIVIARQSASAQVVQRAESTDGVLSVRPTGQSSDGLAQLSVVLDAAPASDRSAQIVEDLRHNLDQVSGADALVGGPDAQAVDQAAGASHDLRLVVPSVLAVVFVILIVLLRALVAPVLLLLSTILSSVAALGAGTWISLHIAGFPALDDGVPLFAFLFLVALGIDYTIFLVTRAREENLGHDTRTAMVRAVSATGAVITSAGIVLAAVFAVLGMLPLIVLTQLGIIVGLGILLDTFLVRTVVIPAIWSLLGDKVWWPSRPSTGHKDPTA